MQHRPVKKIKYILWIPVLVLLLLVLIAVCFLAVKKQQHQKQEVQSSQQTASFEEYSEKWREGVVTYKGKEYQYDFNRKAYLIMGIDKEGKVEINEDAGNGGGRSDAMFLLVINTETKKMSVVSINRNTMSKVQVYSEEGKRLGEYELQICLQHAYGDGGKLSCNRSVDAVSYLFYNTPISGYLALNMDGITGLNDAVGGVEVKILEDMKTSDGTLKKGQKKVLNGEEAYAYLRNRDESQFDSATQRLRRQEQYINSLFQQLGKRNDSKTAYNIYESVKEYLVTDLNAEEMIRELMTYEYDEQRLFTVPGETRMGEELEEYHVDDDGLYALIIDLFYKEV